MGAEEVPWFIAPGGFEAEEGFVASGAPEFSEPLEAAPALATGRFHRTTAHGCAGPRRRPEVHPILMLPEVGDFFGHRFGGQGPRAMCWNTMAVRWASARSGRPC